MIYLIIVYYQERVNKMFYRQMKLKKFNIFNIFSKKNSKPSSERGSTKKYGKINLM